MIKGRNLMKRRERKLVSLLLALCMTLTLLPVSAFAEETEVPPEAETAVMDETPDAVLLDTTSTCPASIEAVRATASATTYPEDTEKPGDITLTTANVFFADASQPGIYVEVSGLTPGAGYDYTVALDGKTLGSPRKYADKRGMISDNRTIPADSLSVGDATIKVSLQSADKTIVYEETTLPIYFAELSQLPPAVEEMNGDPVLVSTAEFKPYVSVTVPVEQYDVLSAAGVTAKLSKNGTDYADTLSDKLSVYTLTCQDLRYGNIFANMPYFGISCVRTGGTFYSGRAFAPGLYDISYYGADGSLLYTFQNAVQVVDCPLVEVNSYVSPGTGTGHQNVAGSKTAYGKLTLTNGQLSAFAMKVYQNGTLLGSSSDFRVANVYEESIDAVCTIPLNTELEQGKQYTLAVEYSGEDLAGGTSKTFYCGSTSVADAMFSNHYYANAILLTSGFDSQEIYKIELWKGNTNGTLLSTMYASPDADGLFDIEFTDADGNVVTLERNQNYCIALYEKNSWNNEWSTSTLQNIYLYNQMPQNGLSLLAEEDSISVNIKSANIGTFYNGESDIYLRLTAAETETGRVVDPSKFSVRMNNILGGNTTLTIATGDTRVTSAGERYFDLPVTADASLPDGYYWCELLYDGKLLLDAATGENVLTSQRPTLKGALPDISYFSNDYKSLYINPGMSARGVSDDQQFTAKFYRFGNLTTTPDYTVEDFFKEGDWDYQPFQMDQKQRYRTEVYLDGRPVERSDLGYWASWKQLNNADAYTVTAASTENGRIEIIPCVGTDSSAVPGFTEVYVKATPASGYQLKSGSIRVNGSAIPGRGFLVTENCTVTAEFEPLPVETYSISVRTGSDDGSVTTVDRAASGDTVTVTITPNAGYILSEHYYYNKTDDQQQPLTKNDDGTWSFTMPAEPVEIYVSFMPESPHDIRVTPHNEPCGSVELSHTTAMSGTEITVTAKPNSGYRLSDFTGYYDDEDSVRQEFPLTEGTAPNTWTFTMPAYGVIIAYTCTQLQQRSISCAPTTYGAVAASATACYAGDTVTLTVSPAEGYRLQENSLYVSYNGGTITPTQNVDGTYSFLMPDADVTLNAEFEMIPTTVPGGTVTSPETLQAALGGSSYAVVNGSTVMLLRNVILTNMVDITAGTMTLDLNNFTVTGPDSTTTDTMAVFRVSGGADLTVTSSASGNYGQIVPGAVQAGQSYHGIWTQGGTLTVSGHLSVFSADSLQQEQSAALFVEGGNVILRRADQMSSTYLVMGKSCGDGIRVTGGIVRIENVGVWGGTRWSSAAVPAEGDISLQGGTAVDDEEWANMSGGDAVHASGACTVVIQNGTFHGGAHASALRVDAMPAQDPDISGTEEGRAEDNRVRVKGGIFEAPYGTPLRVTDGSAILRISEAEIVQGWQNSIDLTGKTLKDCLKEGSGATDWNGNLLSEEALSESQYAGDILIGVLHTVTVEKAEGGTVLSSAETTLSGTRITFRPLPELGYTMSGLWYVEEGSTERYPVDSMSGSYSVIMPDANITVYAAFQQLAETQFLQKNRFSTRESEWQLQLVIPQDVQEQVWRLDWNSAYVHAVLADANGNIVTAQDNFGSYQWIRLVNPGLAAGQYRLFVTVGDSDNTIPLGWQTVELMDATPYGCWVNRQTITVVTQQITVNCWLECPIPILPDDLTLELLRENGTVAVSSDAYTIEYYGNGNTAADKNEKDSGYSSLRFDLDLSGVRLEEGTYRLRLRSQKLGLMRSDENSFQIQDIPYVSDGIYDPDTGIWTGTTENLAPGDYGVYEYRWNGTTNVRVEYTLHVQASGAASITFAESPFQGDSNRLRLYLPYGSDGQSVGFSVEMPGKEISGGKGERYQAILEGACYVGANVNGQHVEKAFPMTESSRTIKVTMEGAPGRGSYEVIRQSYDSASGWKETCVAEDEVENLAAFSFRLTSIQPGDVYYLKTYNSDGENISQCQFTFTYQVMLGYDEFTYGDITGDTFTVYPVNMTKDLDTLRLGYRTYEGNVELPYTVNADGSISVDVTSVPVGNWKPWATYGDDRELSLGWTYNRSGPQAESPALQVEPLVPTSANGVISADVTYTGGTPASNVTMHIYRQDGETLTYHKTVDIGTGTYAIRSDTLELAGTYVFFFTLADGTYLGARSCAFGQVEFYTVTFLDWNGTVLAVRTVAPGGDAAAPDSPEREGYTFTGWSGSYTNVNSDVTVTARYAKNTLTVTFFLSGGTGGPGTVTVNSGETLSKPTEQPTREGYTFTGWYTTPACTQKFVFDSTKPASDIILYAGWEKLPYAITTSDSRIIVAGSAREGETVTVTVTSPYLTSLTWAGIGSSYSVPMVQNGSIWTGSFTMPGENVTLSAECLATNGSITVTSPRESLSSVSVVCYDPWIYQSVSDTGWCQFTELPFGTYYVEAAAGSGYFESKTVIISAENPAQTVTFDVPVLYTVSGTLTTSTGMIPSDLWLYAYDSASGAYMGSASAGSDGSFSFQLPKGTYRLEAYGSNGGYQMQLGDSNVFAVSESTDSLSANLICGVTVVTTLNRTESLGAYRAYLVLEKQNGDSWDYVASQSGDPADGTKYSFESAIFEAGTYRVRLDGLMTHTYTGLEYSSDPVEFTIEDPALSRCKTKPLTYSPAATSRPATLTGPENLVVLSKTEVYPGDYVDLTIRYQSDNGTAIAPSFALELPAGVTRADTGALKISAPAASGTLHAGLKIGADASGVLSIPVKVTLGGETSVFGTAVLTVAQVTLTAPASVRSGEKFTVYGEAGADSTVTIRDMDSGKVLATAPVSGRFYSAQVTLDGYDTYNLVAEVSSGTGVARSEPAAVKVDYKTPITVSSVQYGYEYMENAGLNARLNTFSFYQYVDMDLMGFNLPLAVTFNDANNSIRSVTYHFCGQNYIAGYDGTRWTATFGEKTWGGSGLKTITADVTTNSGETLTFTIAVVNLLIDPSGVVTDENGQPLPGVTVICQVKKGDEWVNLNAASIGQVNPQVTDEQGRYGWNVPEGEYRVLAFKEGYQDYDSSASGNFGSITIPPARSDINFSMKPVERAYTIYPTAVPNAAVTVKDSAKSGSKVQLTVAPEAGLRVASVNVVTVSGSQPVLVEKAGDNTYTFTMPAEDVKYAVTLASEASTSVAVTSVNVSGSTGTVNAALFNLNQSASVVAAFYDNTGRMLGVGMEAAESGTGSVSVAATLSGTPATVRVFLLDTVSRTPLARYAESGVSGSK